MACIVLKWPKTDTTKGSDKSIATNQKIAEALGGVLNLVSQHASIEVVYHGVDGMRKVGNATKIGVATNFKMNNVPKGG